MRRLAWLLSIALLLAPAAAGARTERTVHWTADRVFPTAVRFLRVDAKVTIIEKDADAGYVVFEITDDGKTYPGSLEVIPVSDDPVEVKVAITIEDRPAYMEEVLLEKLEAKLKSELGSPPRKQKPKPEPKPEPEPEPKPDDEG
jgi:hypothetical protein